MISDMPRLRAYRVPTPLLKLTSPILSIMSFLTPKKRRLWVFGAWFGKKYGDNTRILYEYLAERQDVQAVWITESESIVSELATKGLPVFHARSIFGIYHCMRAAYAFYTCGPLDVSPYTIWGSKKIQLWHGIPLKKILYDDDVRYPKTASGKLKKWVHYIIRSMMPERRQVWSYVISSSPTVTARLSSAFNIDSSKILETGYPRQDRILLARSETAPRKTILYAPTHRYEGKGSFREVDYFSGLDMSRLTDVLEKSNSQLVIKLHSFHDPDKLTSMFKGMSHVVVAPADADIYDMLPSVSVLITDYSSIYIDYLVLDRPMIFFAFDLENYLRTERGMYECYEVATPGEKCRDWISVLREMERLATGGDGYALARAEANERYFGVSDARNCDRIVSWLLEVA